MIQGYPQAEQALVVPAQDSVTNVSINTHASENIPLDSTAEPVVFKNAERGGIMLLIGVLGMLETFSANPTGEQAFLMTLPLSIFAVGFFDLTQRHIAHMYGKHTQRIQRFI